MSIKDHFEAGLKVAKYNRDMAHEESDAFEDLIRCAERLGVWKETLEELKRQQEFIDRDAKDAATIYTLAKMGFNSKFPPEEKEE